MSRNRNQSCRRGYYVERAGAFLRELCMKYSSTMSSTKNTFLSFFCVGKLLSSPFLYFKLFVCLRQSIYSSLFFSVSFKVPKNMECPPTRFQVEVHSYRDKFIFYLHYKRRCCYY
jgi:hypothetical protein